MDDSLKKYCKGNSQSDFIRYNNFFSKSNRSQVTIFIIFALMIIVVIAIIFLLRTTPKGEVIDEKNPQAYIESCVREKTEEAIDILSKQGGDIYPKGYLMHNGEDIVYLCYNGLYYKFCTNQRPLLVEHIQDEITNYITPYIENCFRLMENQLKTRYDIETGNIKVVTILYPNQVVVEVDKKFKMSRGDKVMEFNKFKMNMIGPIYNFAQISMEIVNQEAQYCHFDELGYMILHPRFDISWTITGESDKIYTLKERETGHEFKFATKSCLLPPGF